MGNNRRTATIVGVVAATGIALWAVRGSGHTESDATSLVTANETNGRRAVSGNAAGARPESATNSARSTSEETRRLAGGAATSSAHPDDDPNAPARGCASLSFGECSFLEPDAETVDELARCGVVRYETPTFLEAGEDSGFDAEWLNANSVTETEQRALTKAATAARAHHRAELISLALEVGIDQTWATTSSPFLTWAMIESDVGADDRRAAARKIALEQAGKATPSQDDGSSTVAERATRLVATAGDRFEQRVAELLGKERARALHRSGDGWPGRHSDTSSLCRDAAEDAPPPEHFEPSNAEEARRCIADWEGEGCDFLEPNANTLAEMTKCGVVRFELPTFVMTRTAEPRFDDDWAANLDLTDAELAVIAEVAETARDDFYAELVGLAVKTGSDEEWARQTPLLGLLGEIGDGGDDRDTTKAVAHQVAQERSGDSPPHAIDGVDPRAEAAYRHLLGFGDVFESALAERLGPERARELRLADDGWPGNKAQTPSQCED